MKNIYIRLAVIGGVVALGATAIAQSMLASRATTDPEPIEIAQVLSEGENEAATPPVSPFPESQVVLAANQTPADSSETQEPTPARPPESENPTPPPAARFRFSQSTATPAEEAPANPAARSDSSGTDSSAPSRFSRFLDDASRGPTASPGEDDSPSATPAPPAPQSSGSRFALSDDNPAPPPTNPAHASSDDHSAQANPGTVASESSVGDNATEAGSAPPMPGAMPPSPRRFAQSGQADDQADSDAAPPPPVRFRMSDAADSLQNAAERGSEQFQNQVNSAAQQLTDTAEEANAAVRDAASRFSSMAGQAAQSLQDQAQQGISAAEQAAQSLTQEPAVTSNANPAAPPSAGPSGYGGYSAPSRAELGQPEPSQPPQTAATTPTAEPPAVASDSGPAMPQPSVLGAGPAASAPVSAEPYGSGGYRSGGTAAMPISRSAAPAGVAAQLVSARPGDVRLEGDQMPSIRLEKIAPPEVQMGKVTTFELQVENNGNVDASNVIVRDMVPAGTKLVSTTPQAAEGPDGSLVWHLGTLKPQERRSLKLEILPLEEGNIGSVASVSFAATASAKSVVTRPQLKLEQSAAATVLAGQALKLTITLSNPGTGAATGVVLEENVPSGFSHPAGDELEMEVGTLKPGESRQFELLLQADAAGRVQNVLRARADGNLTAEHAVDVEVIAPKLQVAMTGPKLRYLERPAKYTVSVSNPGTAPAHEIDVVTYLPKGLKFVEANNAGQYDATRHAVFWSLEELPPAQTGTVELVALPIEPGEQRLRVESTSVGGLTAEDESTVRVEGLAAIYFEVVDAADPIEVGKNTTYEIKVVNQGSKEATNIRVAALLPEGLRGVSVDGDANGQINGQQIVFQPIPRIEPKQSIRLQVEVQGVQSGDQRIRVQVTTDGIPDPITKEESTTVYTDQ